MNDKVQYGQLLRAEDVAKLLSLGRSRVYQLMTSGELPTVRIGSRLLRVEADTLKRWIAARRCIDATENREGGCK